MRRERQGWFGIKRGNVEDQNAIGWNLSVHLLRSSAKDPPAFRTPLPVSFSPVEHLYYTRRRHARHDCRADSLSLVVYLLFAELLFSFRICVGPTMAQQLLRLVRQLVLFIFCSAPVAVSDASTGAYYIHRCDFHLASVSRAAPHSITRCRSHFPPAPSCASLHPALDRAHVCTHAAAVCWK